MRTIEQIQAEMAGVQASIPELAALNSPSQVSFFALLKNMWATLVQYLEVEAESAINALQAALDEQEVGSIAWYAKTIKAFQFGDNVSVYNGRAGYAVIDPSKRVVKQVSITEDPSGRLLVKTAKGNVDPELIPLTSDELTALKDYIRSVKYAGVAVDVVSLPPDVVKLYATVEYDRQVLSKNGELLTNPARLPIIEYFTHYCSALPFDSTFSWTALSQYMKTNCPGCIDFQINQSLIKPSGATDYTPFTREVVSRAGYIVRDNFCEFTYV